MQHVLLRKDCQSLQIAVSGASVLRPLRLCVDAIVPTRRLKYHLAALRWLNDIHGGSRPMASASPAGRCHGRW